MGFEFSDGSVECVAETVEEGVFLTEWNGDLIDRLDLWVRGTFSEESGGTGQWIEVRILGIEGGALDTWWGVVFVV